MQAVILVGGYGTRIGEETHIKPKPMIEIGSKPILWHIMKLYSHYGVDDFILCLGYRGYMIKEYFANYPLHNADITFDLKSNQSWVHRDESEPWKVTLVETGIDTMTGGRIKQIEKYITGDTFCLTYGDGLSDVDITKLLDFHQKSGKLATVTAVQTAGRFGSLNLDEDNTVESFEEKPHGEFGWINGGFFVLNKGIFDLIDNNPQTTWEAGPMVGLAERGELVAYKHQGFWQPMDTMRDKNHLEKLWQTGSAPWQVWS